MPSSDFERAVFVPLPPPTPADLESIVPRIHSRMLRWPRRRGLIADDEPFSNDRPEPAPLDRFSQAALGIGRLALVLPHQIAEAPLASADHGAEQDDALDAFFSSDASGSHRGRAVHGWSLHASTTVASGDRAALERLLRYFTRPPLAQARLFLLRDGRVAYQLRKPDIDALSCDCGGRLRFLDLITDANEARRLLGKLGRLCDRRLCLGPVPASATQPALTT